MQSGAAGHPFVGPGAYRQPCRTAWPLGCDKDMATSQQLTATAPPLGHYDIDAASFRTGNALRDHRVRSAGFLDARRFPAISFTDGRISFGVTTSPGLAGRHLDLSLHVRCVQNSWGAAIGHV